MHSCCCCCQAYGQDSGHSKTHVHRSKPAQLPAMFSLNGVCHGPEAGALRQSPGSQCNSSLCTILLSAAATTLRCLNFLQDCVCKPALVMVFVSSQCRARYKATCMKVDSGAFSAYNCPEAKCWNTRNVKCTTIAMHKGRYQMQHLLPHHWISCHCCPPTRCHCWHCPLFLHLRHSCCPTPCHHAPVCSDTLAGIESGTQDYDVSGWESNCGPHPCTSCSMQTPRQVPV